MDIHGERMKKDYWLPVLALVNWGAMMLLMPRLPDRVPMHWNIRGEIDSWGSKEHLIWIGALGIGMWALLTVLPALDPKRENYSKFASAYRVIRTVVVVMMIAVGWMSQAAAMGGKVDVILILKILLALVFIVMGNVLTRVRPAWFVGIRTPWTLSDTRVWRKTHRLGGFLMVFGGLLFIPSALFFPGTLGLVLPFGVIIGGSLVAAVYSGLLWRGFHRGERIRHP